MKTKQFYIPEQEIYLLKLVSQKIGRYSFLLTSMFLMIGLRPFLDDLVRVELLADIFFSCVLMSGIYALSKNPIALRISLFLVLAIAGLKISHHFSQSTNFHTAELALSALFFAQMLIMILKHLLIEQDITADMVMGGACAFILLGLIWAYAYYLLEICHPNSFKAADQLGDDIADFIYYSFVTLTSLGYGDILATSKQARSLTILEAIVGQLYLAIMISRLVSLHLSESHHK